MLAGGLAPGGSSLYAALTAAALGCNAHIVTSHGPDFVGLAQLRAAGVTVEAAGTVTTTFENVYRDGARAQRVRAVADRLDAPAPGDVVFCCPVIDEVGPAAVAGSLVGAGLQGWLRRLDLDGTVLPKDLPDPGFLGACRVVFLSQDDVPDAAALVARLREVVPIVVVTRGAAGADVFAEQLTHVPARPAREVDPTGAGDVFAAAYLIALSRGQDPVTAGHFGARAAAVVVEATGPSALLDLCARMTD